MHQLLLLPFTAGLPHRVLSFCFAGCARDDACLFDAAVDSTHAPSILAGAVCNALSAAAYYYESKHFERRSGIAKFWWAAGVPSEVSPPCSFCVRYASSATPGNESLRRKSFTCYLVAMVLAVRSFPAKLSALRHASRSSLWADTNLIHHISPYATMFVGGRVYDFPYLPGMLLCYLPAVAAHVDLRLHHQWSSVAGFGAAHFSAGPPRPSRRSRRAAGGLFDLPLPPVPA